MQEFFWRYIPPGLLAASGMALTYGVTNADAPYIFAGAAGVSILFLSCSSLYLVKRRCYGPGWAVFLSAGLLALNGLAAGKAAVVLTARPVSWGEAVLAALYAAAGLLLVFLNVSRILRGAALFYADLDRGGGNFTGYFGDESAIEEKIAGETSPRRLRHYAASVWLSPYARAKACDRLGDRTLAEALYMEIWDENGEWCDAAVERMSDQTNLSIILEQTKSAAVRFAAAGRLQNEFEAQKVYAKLARGSNWRFGLLALGKLYDIPLLFTVADKAPDEVKIAAADKLFLHKEELKYTKPATDSDYDAYRRLAQYPVELAALNILVEIAVENKNVETARLALDKIDAPLALAHIALHAKHMHIRISAAEKLGDYETQKETYADAAMGGELWAAMDGVAGLFKLGAWEKLERVREHARFENVREAAAKKPALCLPDGLETGADNNTALCPYEPPAPKAMHHGPSRRPAVERLKDFAYSEYAFWAYLVLAGCVYSLYGYIAQTGPFRSAAPTPVMKIIVLMAMLLPAIFISATRHRRRRDD